MSNGGDSFFPEGDNQFRTWLLNFVANEGVVTPLNLPIDFFDALNAASTTYGTELDAHVDQQAAAQAQTAVKDGSKGGAVGELRPVVGSLRANPGFTDEMALALGLPLLDDILTHIVAPTVAPELEMAAFGPQEVRIHFWDPGNPAPGRRGKAPGARSCRLIFAILAVGAGAPAATSMAFLADDTNTPNNANFDAADIGKTLWVRGAWVSPTGELGPFSEPSSITIPG